MTGADYIVKVLLDLGVTDVFGIPGGVVLDLLYAFDREKERIVPHLSYHEQAAGFAACGYAQASGRLGVAYATRGPGFTNLLTPIADAYYDSIPSVFITAHTSPCPAKDMRVMVDQEMDTCEMVRTITKSACRADDITRFAEVFKGLCELASKGRKGPVFVDVSTSILKSEIQVENAVEANKEHRVTDGVNLAADDIERSIREARRPVILVGDGVRQANEVASLRSFAPKAGIPVISSRFSHDFVDDSDLYYGYVGSHGTRCANFILSKADLVVSLGNRLHFPPESESYGKLLNRMRIIRCEVDEREFIRRIENAKNYPVDLSDLLPLLSGGTRNYGRHEEWISVCDDMRDSLFGTDRNEVVSKLSFLLSNLSKDYIVVADVGNNEFWLSRACVESGGHRVLYSKSFGAVGCAIGKAIGAYYATRRPVMCVVGDQGIQMNIQELQYVSQHGLPILIVIINNRVSGMIRDREKNRGYFLHTTAESGFLSPRYERIAMAYGVRYLEWEDAEKDKEAFLMTESRSPRVLNIDAREDLELSPRLALGKDCQDMEPALDKELYERLNNL